MKPQKTAGLLILVFIWSFWILTCGDDEQFLYEFDFCYFSGKQ